MSDNEDTPQTPRATELGVLALLNHVPVDPNESKRKNISNNEDIQKSTNELINELNSKSMTPDDNTIRRQSITSGRFTDDKENSSTPAINDTSANNTIQPPVRSMSESALIDTTEQSSALPIQQDVSSTDGDDLYGIQSKPNNTINNNNDESTDQLPQDSSSQERENNTNSSLNDDFFNSKTRTVDDNQRPPSTKNQNHLDESPRSGKTSPKPSTSRKQSSSTSGDEKRGQLPDETGTDTDRDNQEVAAISRRPSVAKSPINRPQAPSPSDDSRKTPTNDLSKLARPGEQLQIPTDDINNGRINSPPPSSPSGNNQLASANPLIGDDLVKTDQDSSRPSSKKIRKSPSSSSVTNEKMIDGEIIPSKTRQSSNTSQQRTTITDQKTNVSSAHKGSTRASRQNSSDQNKKDSRRSSTDNDLHLNDKRQSSSQKRSGQQSRKGSNKTTDSKKSGKHLSTTDSDNEPSKVPPVTSTTPTKDNQASHSRPQSPNVEQIAERNQTPKTPIKKKEQRRSNSAESFGRIPIVDDKSLDSTSENNTETEKQKKRRVKSKKKDVETNTDGKNESTPQKSSKSIRHSVKQSKESNDDRDPVNVNAPVLDKNISLNNNDNNTKKQLNKSTIDYERHTQSDTEQVITEKQKKRRRPKRISRTTQTYERYFRQRDDEQPEELRPTNDTDKSIQTRKSQLRPKPKSPRKRYPVYLSADAFKIEEISPRHYSQNQPTHSKTAVVPHNISPQNGKLLILRPTLPFHHTDAVNIQRISLQYAIDLIPNETKSNTPKQSEQLPMIHSPVPPPTSFPINKSNTKDKSISNKTEVRTHQRKNGGAV